MDFVIQRGLEEVVAIEVKSGKRTDNQGIHTFADSFHPKYSIVVGGVGDISVNHINNFVIF